MIAAGRVLALVLAASAVAQARPTDRELLARVLDVATLGIAPFGGAVLNRKLTVDTLRLAPDGERRIAVYLVPSARATDAARHFASQLGIAARRSPDGATAWWFLSCRAAPGCPAAATDLSVTIEPSPWADGAVQIVLQRPGDETYTPAPRPPLYP